MNIWSVDSVEKKIVGRNESRILYRFVHYKDDVGGTPGVRYFVSPLTEKGPLGWGEAYSLPRSQEEPQREDGTVLLEHPEELEPVPDIEVELRHEGTAAFSAARERSSEGLDAPEARPIIKEGKPPDLDKRPIWAKIYVQNVGQGDTIVLELPENQLWLIDARLWGKSRREQFSRWMKKTFNGRTSFDKVIVTHLHYDHIHSIPFILDEYDVDEVFVPDSLSHPTSSAQRVWEKAGSRLRSASGGRSFRQGKLDIQFIQTSDLAPCRNTVSSSRDPNNHEIAILMRTDQSAAFLAGDVPADLCSAIVRQAGWIDQVRKPYRFYKVSHHGSVTGCSEEFPAAYDPDDAIVSCGQVNRYGHPHCPPAQFNRLTWRDGQEVYSYSLW